MRVPTDLPRSGLINWLNDAMARDQRDMGRYARDAFPTRGRYVNPIWRASQRRMFYEARRRYEVAKKEMEKIA